MSDIGIGEYVRTETGFIRRIKSVDKTEATEKCPVNMYWCNLDKPIKILKECSKDTIYAIEMSDAKKLKHSNNILDLIEVGDIVNKELVIDIIDIANDKEEIIGRKLITQYRSAQFTGLDIKHYIYANDIKTILTKESYMANCYKVGGEE